VTTAAGTSRRGDERQLCRWAEWAHLYHRRPMTAGPSTQRTRRWWRVSVWRSCAARH